MYDEGLLQVVEKFKSDTVDFHQTVADMAGISRSNAKTINLRYYSMVWVKQNYKLN
jgi:hypothetical protein